MSHYSFIFKNEVIEKENLDKNKMGGGDYVVVKADRKEVKAIQDKSTGFVSGMAQVYYSIHNDPLYYICIAHVKETYLLILNKLILLIIYKSINMKFIYFY